MDLGSTIIQLRKSKGITQDDLAEKCGITQAYLSQIENNKKEPNLAILKGISDNLEVPMAVIFFLSMEKEDVPVAKQAMFDTLKPSMSGLINTIFLDDSAANNK